MTGFTKAERESYNITREGKCDQLDITTNQYNYLRRISQAITKVDTDFCNGEIDSMDLHDEEVGDLLEKARGYLNVTRPDHLHLFHQSDPRGVALYVGDSEMDQSNYDRIGVSIY